MAVQAEAIVGQVAGSPVSIAGAGDWFGLGPVSVRPAFQRRGIGGALILAALARLKQQGAAGCLVLGDPRYYARFGFAHQQGLSYRHPAALPAGDSIRRRLARRRGRLSRCIRRSLSRRRLEG